MDADEYEKIMNMFIEHIQYSVQIIKYSNISEINSSKRHYLTLSFNSQSELGL